MENKTLEEVVKEGSLNALGVLSKEYHWNNDKGKEALERLKQISQICGIAPKDIPEVKEFADNQIKERLNKAGNYPENREYVNIISLYKALCYKDEERLNINPQLAQRTIENLIKTDQVNFCEGSLIAQVIDFKSLLSPELRQKYLAEIVQYLANQNNQERSRSQELFNDIKQKIENWREALSYNPEQFALASVYQKLITDGDYSLIKAICEGSGEKPEEALFIREYAKRLKSERWRPAHGNEGCLDELAKSCGYPHPERLLQRKYNRLFESDCMKTLQELYHATSVFPSQKLLEKIGRKALTRKPNSDFWV